jgi:hypothetical protein
MRESIISSRVQAMCMCCRMSGSRVNASAGAPDLIRLRPDGGEC